MSYSDDDTQHQSGLEGVLQKYANGKAAQKVRYASTKGDADRRKLTSKENMAKARAARLAQLQSQKQESESEEESDGEAEDLSDESEEELVLKPVKRMNKPQKGKGRGGSAAASAVNDGEMQRLLMMQMSALLAQQQKGKKKKKPVVKQSTPAPANTPNPAAVEAKREIRNALNF